MRSFRITAATLLLFVLGGYPHALSSDKDQNKTEKRAGVKTVVWIDTDPSVATGGHEVDDGFALIQAFHSGELEIRGVSVVFGNAPLRTSFPIAREIVRRFGPRGLLVFAGAADAGQLGTETPATRALAAALAKEKMTVLMLGPATNVATVVKNHPKLCDRIDRIIAVAGRRPDQRFTYGAKQGKPFRDFNFELDAAGFQILLDSKVPIVLAPWELSSKIWLTASDVKRLASGNAATQWLAQPATDWLAVWRERFGLDGFNPFDTLAVGYVTSPQWIECQDLPVEIRRLPDDANDQRGEDGKAAEKPYLLVSKEFSSKRLVRYCYNVAQDFKKDLMKRLLD